MLSKMRMQAETFVNSVIFISCDEKPAKAIIKNILNIEELPSALEINGIAGYEWKITTKYYSAIANMYPIEEKKEFRTDFAESIQAVVFYFNSKEPASFDSVVSWKPLLRNVSADVQLLLCEDCNYEEPQKKNILNWCVENQFELIELNSKDNESDSEDECVISNTNGYSRVIEALQTCVWSDLEMKKSSEEETFSNQNQACSEAASSNVPENNTDQLKTVKVGNEEVTLEDQWVQKVLEQDDPEGEAFEALFSKFASMKDKASGLHGEERKKYAEQVAIAFWRAMGCDEEEIAGLEDEIS